MYSYEAKKHNLIKVCFIMCSHLGIKQVRFGGSEFESWNDSLNTEEAGYSVHKI
jgi:hypothetical protein